VNAVAVQSDGKVLIGGYFSSVNGVTRLRIARLNGDGSLDVNFNPGSDSADSLVSAIGVQPDGKVVVSGQFMSLGGSARFGMARVNSDGSLDDAYQPQIRRSGVVNAVAVDSSGRMLAGGDFIEVGEVSRNGVARLNADGRWTADSTRAAGRTGW